MLPTVTAVATSTEFRKYVVKSSRVNSSRKLSRVTDSGHQVGGMERISASGLIEEIAIHRNGMTIRIRPSPRAT